MKISITGIGVVSAIGMNAEENLHSLRAGETGIRPSSSHNLMVGAVAMTNREIMDALNLAEADYSRTTLLGLIAAREAWGRNQHTNLLRTGIISATSVGGMDRMEEYYAENRGKKNEAVYKRMTHDNGRCTEWIAREMGFSGYIGTISTACSSGANAIMQGARLMEGNRLDRVLAGASEPLAQFDVKGFESLNIYDQGICKPFDEYRKGLNLGEGAAFVLLENERSLAITGNKPLCELAGWNNATDAFHQTASSANGKGAALAMMHALQKAGLQSNEINYVNAHGTGTGNNDLSESAALQSVFGQAIPAFSSTKGFTGHTLGAAGAIEAVYCVQSILSQSVLPNLNFTTPMKETGLIPENRFRSLTDSGHVLSNSFGFGGNCTSLIFSKAQ